MHKINASLCTNCGLCASECPVEAISENGGVHVISDACVDCGACVSVCPVEAISG
ncbi:MAG TPA: 4Fe-4S binding protein [bacterium]|jgi:ferredoxin|nr:4Fe-4S binding protein [bacterium]MDX9804764.1 4Fe-4S binding protein [bacterium]HNZ53455.1 4Fe-4S binding protein [bacterium]HOG44787.1 4Fe-4S binding protein [bacterium]HPA56787.1 4Fe-4S binding protein [bacterium]